MTVPDIGCTGSDEMSRCHALSAGNVGQEPSALRAPSRGSVGAEEPEGPEERGQEEVEGSAYGTGPGGRRVAGKDITCGARTTQR